LKFGAERVERVEIRAATTGDCAAVECLRRGLLDLDVSALPDHAGRTLAGDVELSHASAPRIDVSGVAAGKTQYSACVDPTPSIHGKLRSDDIQAVIRSHQAGFRRCYDAAFAVEQTPHGNAAMSFIVDEEGRVTTATVTTTGLADCQVAACVRDELARSVFPKPEGGRVSVRYPLVFEPANQRQTDPEQCLVTRQEQQAPAADDQAMHGRMAPEAIQTTIRAQRARFSHCYEAGLARNSKLTGRLAIRFVIGIDGRVTSAALAENTLPDCEVTRCVRDEFRSFRFPAPQGGSVVVVYPLVFEPG
jgi:hypothetical protein